MRAFYQNWSSITLSVIMGKVAQRTDQCRFDPFWTRTHNPHRSFFAHVYASMLAAQERAAMARLARYQVSVYRALLERDHRLAEDFYAAKARSEV